MVYKSIVIVLLLHNKCRSNRVEQLSNTVIIDLQLLYIILLIVPTSSKIHRQLNVLSTIIVEPFIG